MQILPGDQDLLLIIDVQNDFCPGGALAVADGDAVVPVINRLAERFDHVVLTQDWHPSGHSSFATSHPGSAPFDVIAMPTLTRTAIPIEERLFEPIEIEGRKADSVRKAWYPYTHPFNLTGHPAVTLPCGFHSDGLPMAIQLVGRRGEDARLLRVAALFEAARPWDARRPQIDDMD